MNDFINELKSYFNTGIFTIEPKTLIELGVFAVILIVVMLIGVVAKRLLVPIIKRFNTDKTKYLHATLVSAKKSIGFFSVVIGLGLGFYVLTLPQVITNILNVIHEILVSLLIWFTLYNLTDVIELWLTRHSDKNSAMDKMLPPLMVKTLKIVIVILFFLQFAQILSDKSITSVIAGLGVGGLAVALAAQETIKNFFGSIVIFTDRPFEVGERILVDSFDGVIEEVGFRSTRLRTLTGHLVTIPNGELANKAIENIGKRPHIRRLMNITITYDTKPEKIEEALSIVKSILKDHEGMHEDFPPRVIFNDMASYYLNILVLYWYHPGDYWKFMDFSERINLEIFKQFGDAGIDFAFPSQTTFLAGDKDRPIHWAGQPLNDSEI